MGKYYYNIIFKKCPEAGSRSVSVWRLMCKSDEISGFLTFRKSFNSSTCTIPLQQNAPEN
jgi:hypothetical protein